MENADAMGLDPIEEQHDSQEGVLQNEDTTSNDDSQVIADMLAANGIADPSRIKFEDEGGAVTERDWNSLTREEKYGVLSSGKEADSSLSDDEIQLLNSIRESGRTPDAYINSLKETAAKDAGARSYEIDGISDDELFVLDALDKYGEDNVSDEQLETLLSNAKSDPELYTKTISALRNEYKRREDDLKLQDQKREDEKSAADFQDFSDTVLNEIEALQRNTSQQLELTVDDMNDLANFILTRDDNGNSEFGKMMNDPKQLVQLAFWALKGDEIMKEISSQLKLAYDRGVAAGKGGRSRLAFNDRKDAGPVRGAYQSASELDVQ